MGPEGTGGDIPVGYAPESGRGRIAIVDLDGSQGPDLAVAGSGVSVLRNRGDGRASAVAT
jgi:hypothetical protein